MNPGPGRGGAIAIEKVIVPDPDATVRIRGYAGHTYQLQSRGRLDPDA